MIQENVVLDKKLDYLYNKPTTIYWNVIAPKGYRLSVLEDHDLIYDDYDLKIRKLK